jgi:hypothetical protein
MVTYSRSFEAALVEFCVAVFFPAAGASGSSSVDMVPIEKKRYSFVLFCLQVEGERARLDIERKAKQVKFWEAALRQPSTG